MEPEKFALSFSRLYSKPTIFFWLVCRSIHCAIHRKHYMSMRTTYKIDQANWRLLTGERGEVDALLKKLRVQTVKTPTRFADDGRPIYFIDHTDRITLIDHKGNVKRNYSGSDVNSEEVVRDVKQLLSEINN